MNESRRKNVILGASAVLVLVGVAVVGLLLGKHFRKESQTADSLTSSETSTTVAETTLPHDQTADSVNSGSSALSSSSSSAATTGTSDLTTAAVSKDKLAAPTSPSCLIYESPIEGVTIVFSWDRVPGASGYELSVTETKFYGETYTNVYDVETNTHKIGCSDYGTMDCRVRAYIKQNGNKEFSDWSAVFTSSASVIPGVHAEFCTRYGQINTHGAKAVCGYSDLYVANNGKEELERNDLQNGWHVTGNAYLDSRGVRWYMLHDTDDNDYYGWVDEQFIDWYDSEGAVTQTKVVSGIERAYSDYIFSLMQSPDYAQHRADPTEQYMYEPVDINQDGTPELIISHGETFASGDCELLAYVNGQCKQLLPSCGSYGSAVYNAAYKLLCSGYGHMGYVYYDYYSFDGTRLSLADSITMEPDPDNPEQSVCTHNGTSITEDAFWALIEKYQSDICVGRKYNFPDNPSTDWVLSLS